MIRDMDLAGLVLSTQKTYMRAVVDLLRYCGKNRAELITEEEVYCYLLWLRDEREVSRGTFQTRFSGVKFLFYRTMDRNWALFLKNGFGSRGRSVCRGRFPGSSAAA